MSTERNTIENYFKKQSIIQLDTPKSPEPEKKSHKEPLDETATETEVEATVETTAAKEASEKSLSRTIELDRNVAIKLERISSELLEELCASPTRLSQFAEEQARKYPTPKFAQKSIQRYDKSNQSKRKREKTHLNRSREAKIPKFKHPNSNKKYSYDLFGMKEKDALDKSILCDSAHVSLAGNTSTASTNNEEIILNTTLNQSSICQLSSSSIDSEYTNIELNLLRLCALHKLTHPAIGAGDDVNDGDGEGVYEEEYVVSRVHQVEYDDVLRVPKFKVEWKGYEGTPQQYTWEPISNIYDCKAFQTYTKNFVYRWRVDLERIWNELVATVAAESLEPELSGLEAIEQCRKFNYNDFLANMFILARMRDADEDPHSKGFKRVYKFLRNKFKYINYYTRRLQQLQNMKLFQDDINKVDQSKNLQVENTVDLEMPPMDEFIYTNDVIPRDGIDIDDNPPIGCDCAGDDECSDKSKCLGEHYDGITNAKFPYTSRGLLSAWVGPRTPIYECNKKCKCSMNCPNRVVQKGRKQTLAIFKTEERGWGVRTKRQIAQGQYICEYVGEIISYDEAERRGKEYDAVGRTYLFDLDFNGTDNPYTVDAAKYGNVSRFINHSCNPNLGVWPVWTDCLEPDLHKLCLFTLRPISKDEELTFDYKQGSINEPHTSDEQKTTEIDDIDIKQDGFTCKCGASNCRKTIFL